MDMAAFQASKDRVREHFNRFTRKAFEMLPKLDRPFILDVGCGSGGSDDGTGGDQQWADNRSGY